MARWTEFAAAAPGLARAIRERFEAHGVVILGTLRRDGAPRLTPIEFGFYDGDLCLGMMWQSRKALDLLQDPRCSLHSPTTDKSGAAGDAKLSCVAIDEGDPGRRERFAALAEEQTGWRPSEPYHQFRLEIQEAAFVAFGGEAVSRLRPGLEGGQAVVEGRPSDDATAEYLVARWRAG